MNALSNLNYLSYTLVQSFVILRSMDINNHLSNPQFFSSEDFNANLDQITSYQNKLDEDLSDWTYCPASSIVKENIISYWDIRDIGTVRKTNLFNFVEFIKENVFYI